MANKLEILQSGNFRFTIPPKDGVKRTVNLDIVHNIGRFKITADDGSYTHTSISSITVQNQGATVEAMPFDLNDINVFGSDYIYAGTTFPIANNTGKFARLTKDTNGNLIVGLEDNPHINNSNYELLQSTNIYGEAVPIQVFNGRSGFDYIQNFFRDKDNVTFDELFNSMKTGSRDSYRAGALLFSFYVDDADTDKSKDNIYLYRATNENYNSKVTLDNAGMQIDSGTWYSVIISSVRFYTSDNGFGDSNYDYGKIINETTGDIADFKFDGNTFFNSGGKIWIGGAVDSNGNPVKIRYSQFRFIREYLEPALARELSLRILPTTTGE